MIITIQVEDPRGTNVSPTDEKTMTADTKLDIGLWADHIQFYEENGDPDSEGELVYLLPLVLEFLDLVRPKREDDIEKIGEDAAETLPDVMLLLDTLKQSQLAVQKDIDRRLLQIRAGNQVHTDRCNEANRLQRLELNKRGPKL